MLVDRPLLPTSAAVIPWLISIPQLSIAGGMDISGSAKNFAELGHFVD